MLWLVHSVLNLSHLLAFEDVCVDNLRTRHITCCVAELSLPQYIAEGLGLVGKRMCVRDAAASPTRPPSSNPNPLLNNSYLVDPASSHMLVSKIKPCMSTYKLYYTVKLRMAHYISDSFLDGDCTTRIPVVILELIRAYNDAF